jgi:hypothetical protein
MSERKPRLDWIRKVLTDFGARDDRVDATPGVIAVTSTIVPFKPRSRSDHREMEGGGVLLRPSCRPARLTVAQES